MKISRKMIQRKSGRKKLFNAMGKFSGDFENREECKNIFAGIKVYPPLGFDPWPEERA